MDLYTINCLAPLMAIIANDAEIAEYVACLDAPTYQGARYSDWIRPYLEKQLADARKGSYYSTSVKKEELIIMAMSSLEKYEAFLVEHEARLRAKEGVPEPEQREDEVDEFKSFPPPYVIGTSLEERPIVQEEKEEAEL